MWRVAGEPVFLLEDSLCRYFFEWSTALACPQVAAHMSCELFTEDGSHYDLSLLTLDNSNYEVRHGSATYLLNVCGPIVRRPGNVCPVGAAACSLTEGEARYSRENVALLCAQSLV